MKPAPFDWYNPTTTAEAVDCLGEVGPDGKVLAGGQSLIPMLAMRLAELNLSELIDAMLELGRERRLDGAEAVASDEDQVKAAHPAARGRTA